MGFFAKIFGVGKNPKSYAFKLQRARELHGQSIKYVTENRDNNDDVIGNGGSIALHGDELIVDASGERIFRCKVENLEASYLMSGDGVVLRGIDEISGNTYRTVTVHFVNFYRR